MIWYIRRSRGRFKANPALATQGLDARPPKGRFRVDNEADKKAALSTTAFVLRELSKVLAPLMPFIADDLYQKITNGSDKESVHLESWPKVGEIDEKLLGKM